MNMHPPKWIDRFLAWYCNPDLLEEIQGDAHELYYQRLKTEGKRSADWKYLWDVIRFCKWSNIKRENNDYRPGYIEVLLNLNLKIAIRNAARNKLVFSVKVVGLAICFSFALTLTAFVINELTYDHHHQEHESIYRIGSRIDLHGVVSNYAVSPLPLGQALVDEIPAVEHYTRIMPVARTLIRIGDNTFHERATFTADSNFLKIFTFDFIRGTRDALNEPGRIVLTETLAARCFGGKDPMGQTIEFGPMELEVAAIIKDVPSSSHLQFDALVSWGTYWRNDAWDNVNAYTYIKVKNGTNVVELQAAITQLTNDYLELVAQEYQLTYEPIIQNIGDLHLSGFMEEDVAEKRTKSNVYILMAVVLLFFITGQINYLNVTLAELTSNLKKFGILRIFGGILASPGRIVLTDTFLSLLIVLPLVIVLTSLSFLFAESFFSITIGRSALLHPAFMIIACGFVALLIFSSRINSYVISRSNDIIHSLKGRVSSRQSGFPVREYLVAAQLSFSVIMIALIVIIVDQFRFINETDKGFEDKNTIVLRMPAFDYPRTIALEEAIRKLSGVQKVEGCSYLPAGQVEEKELFALETDDGMKNQLVNYIHCGYGYLDLLEIEMSEGRQFDVTHGTDRKGGYIINEAAAKQFGWKNPIGKKINGPLDADGREGEIIGVVKDFNYASLHNKIEPLIIFLTNEDWGGIQFVYVKVNPVRPPNLIFMIEDVQKKIYPDLPVEWDFLDSRYMSLYKEDQEVRNVFEVGLVISILVSCLGLFSISALLLILRTKEMGIRKVVVASRLQLFILHMKTFFKFLVIAVLIAWPVILYLSQNWLSNFAYHIDLKFGYFIAPVFITLVIVVVTSGYHATKSAMVNPVDILKQE